MGLDDKSKSHPKVWLTFASRARDVVLASILVSETPPVHWQHGRKHGVITHLEEIHDYTASIVDNNDKFSPGNDRRRHRDNDDDDYDRGHGGRDATRTIPRVPRTLPLTLQPSVGTWR